MSKKTKEKYKSEFYEIFLKNGGALRFICQENQDLISEKGSVGKDFVKKLIEFERELQESLIKIDFLERPHMSTQVFLGLISNALANINYELNKDFLNELKKFVSHLEQKNDNFLKEQLEMKDEGK